MSEQDLMNRSGSVLDSRGFYRLGAACCVYYVFAQFIQEITFHYGINDSATGQAEILQRVLPLDQLRAVLILLGFSFIPILTAYAAVTLLRYRLRPAASALGLVFSSVFVGMELSIRSVDLFLISRTWAAQYQATASDALRQAIAGRIQIWDDSVGALYFALLGAHLLASVCFAIALWDRDGKWNRIVAIGFALIAIECVGRIAEGYLGQTWLDGPTHALYFPVVLLNVGTLAIWLWKQPKPVSE